MSNLGDSLRTRAVDERPLWKTQGPTWRLLFQVFEGNDQPDFLYHGERESPPAVIGNAHFVVFEATQATRQVAAVLDEGKAASLKEKQANHSLKAQERLLKIPSTYIRCRPMGPYCFQFLTRQSLSQPEQKRSFSPLRAPTRAVR